MERSRVSGSDRVGGAWHLAKVWGDTLALRAMFPISSDFTSSTPSNYFPHSIQMFQLFNKLAAAQEVVADEFDSDEELQYTETEIEEFDAL